MNGVTGSGLRNPRRGECLLVGGDGLLLLARGGQAVGHGEGLRDVVQEQPTEDRELSHGLTFRRSPWALRPCLRLDP